MKQFVGFCVFAFIVLTIVTGAALFLTFRELQSGNFLEYLNDPGSQSVDVSTTPDAPQVGWTGDAEEASAIQVVLDWNVVEAENDRWNFAPSDPLVRGTSLEPVVTLFGEAQISPTPPWSEELSIEYGSDARDYVETVVDRYADDVRFWQIGGQMDLWVPRDELTTAEFTIEEQAAFLIEVAATIRELDDDAIILLPALSDLSTYSIDSWLSELVSVSGSNWFDVITYRYEGEWQSFGGQHDVLTATLDIERLDEKPVWLVDAPSDIRVVAQAFGGGDDFVAWRSSTEVLEKFAEEVVPFFEATEIVGAINGSNVYKFIREDRAKFVLWGVGSYSIPGTGSVELTDEAQILE